MIIYIAENTVEMEHTMKTAYVGIDILYPVLKSLYDTGCEIVKIFTCDTDNVTEFNTATISFAKEHGIPLQTERITKAHLYELVDMGCDFVLFGGYYHVIPVIDELRIVNTHPALLPLGRGAWPMPLTILKGLTESGVTMHRMVKALDEGDIILQEKIPVYPGDDLMTLTRRQWSVIPGMVQALVSDFDNLWNNATPQTGHAEYWEMPTADDFTITDEYTCEQADLILRAFYSYECYYIDTKSGKKYELIGAICHRNYEPIPHGDNIVLPIKDGFVTSPVHRIVT